MNFSHASFCVIIMSSFYRRNHLFMILDHHFNVIKLLNY